MSQELLDSLFPFQRHDVDRLKGILATELGCLIFNEMGTGKTLEALALVDMLGLSPVLVVCPNSLVLRWWNEIKKWSPTGAFTVANYELFQSFRSDSIL